jgi:hypothetical protein
MGEERDEGASKGRDTLSRSLAKEAGITEDQARELIRMLGTDRNSLLREARILTQRR